MSTELSNQQAQAQAIYMTHLLQRANQLALELPNPAFDPQARLIVDVVLEDDLLKTIIVEINHNSTIEFEMNKAGLENALGLSISPCTTISLDISGSAPLSQRFNSQLGKDFDQETISQIRALNTGSLIALQQEFHFHLALTTRLYGKIPPLDDDQYKIQLTKAHNVTMIQVNALVLNAYAKAIKMNKKHTGVLSLSKINKALDDARKTILPQAHTLLMQEIVKHTGVVLNSSQLNLKSLHDLAIRTSATANDVIHTDHEKSLVTYIEGSEYTAHHRIRGAHFAHKQLISHQLNAKNIVQAKQPTRIQIRTPSPALKTGLNSPITYVVDVCTKLVAIKERYHVDAHTTKDTHLPQAFIYNFYTAINDRLGDMSGNLQTQSAIHILCGVHRYNHEQLKHSDTPVLCLIENISTNGFGERLNPNDEDRVIVELTLMAEMALLHTLYNCTTEHEKSIISGLFQAYKRHLEAPNSANLFSQSVEGIDTREQINALKLNWRNPRTNQAIDKGLSSAKQALKYLIAYNLHFQHKHSKLIQALSVFVEEASLGGCKSGNERAQAINGRVIVLDSVFHDDGALSPDKETIRQLITTLARGEEVGKNSRLLNTAIDKEYNATGLQGAASLVSLIDQGGGAKIKGKPKHPFYFSRNYAEDPVSLMTNLHQTNAGMMQAHKELTQQMQAAWSGHPKSWWATMRSTSLGVLGAILGILTVVPALIVAIYTTYKNKQKQKQTVEATGPILSIKDSYSSVNQQLTLGDQGSPSNQQGNEPLSESDDRTTNLFDSMNTVNYSDISMNKIQHTL